MLDVHPPHAPTHTWRDFLIHIATIVVGLLIAVGLEQTVEALHHAHQRRELREALHIDTGINNEWARRNIETLDRQRHWAIDQLSSLELAGPTGPVRIRRMSKGDIFVPNVGVWLAAKQNGQSALLTVPEQNWLSDLDRVEDDAFVAAAGAGARMDTALAELNRQLIRRSTPLPSGELDLSVMTPAERLNVGDCLRTLMDTIRQFELRNLVYAAYTEYFITTPFDQLEQSDSVKRAIGIYNRNLGAHPDLQLDFQQQ